MDKSIYFDLSIVINKLIHLRQPLPDSNLLLFSAVHNKEKDKGL